MARDTGTRRRGRLAGALANLALALVALAVTLAAAEGLLRVLGYSAIYDVYSRPSLFWRYDSLLGWSHEPGASGTYVGPRPFPIEFESEVRLNALGLRGPELEAREPGEYRVLLLGDSLVAGFEVPYEKHFGTLTEAKLERQLHVPVRVLNGGVRGYGTDQAYLYYRERGRELGADLVVFVHSANDPDDNMTLHRIRRPFGKPAFALGANGSLEILGSPVPHYPACSAWMLSESYEPTRVDGPQHRALCALQMGFADRSALFSFVSIGLGRFSTLPRWLQKWVHPWDQGDAPPREAGLGGPLLGAGAALASVLAAPAGATGEGRVRAQGALTSALLVALGREVRASGAHLIVVIKPTRLATLDEEWLRAELDLRQLYFPPLAGGSFVFENDGHYNERGHFYVAEALVPVIREVYRQAPRSGAEAAAAAGPE